MSTPESLPLLLTVTETATLLRTTRKGVYAMIERGLLPGVTRIGRRVLDVRQPTCHPVTVEELAGAIASILRIAAVDLDPIVSESSPASSYDS